MSCAPREKLRTARDGNDPHEIVRAIRPKRVVAEAGDQVTVPHVLGFHPRIRLVVSVLHRRVNGLLAGELRVNRTLTDPESDRRDKNDDACA